MSKLLEVDSLAVNDLDYLIFKIEGLNPLRSGRTGEIYYLNNYDKRRALVVNGDFILNLIIKYKIWIFFNDGQVTAQLVRKEQKFQHIAVLLDMAVKRCLIISRYGWMVNSKLLDG